MQTHKISVSDRASWPVYPSKSLLLILPDLTWVNYSEKFLPTKQILLLSNGLGSLIMNKCFNSNIFWNDEIAFVVLNYPSEISFPHSDFWQKPFWQTCKFEVHNKYLNTLGLLIEDLLLQTLVCGLQKCCFTGAVKNLLCVSTLAEGPGPWPPGWPRPFFYYLFFNFLEA